MISIYLLTYHREMLLTKDGGTLSLDWFDHEHSNTPASPTILIIPGFEGKHVICVWVY